MSSIYRRNDAELAAEQFEDGLVIINFLTGRYFSMNSTAEAVWALLEHGCSAETVAARLAEHCGVGESDGARLHADLEAFFAQLVQERLVCRDGASTVSPAGTLVAGPIPYEPPHVEVFEDLADLILLDPIHDVNEQLGWPAVRTGVDGE